MTVQVTNNPYVNLVDIAINAGETPFLLGSPGIGKSAFMREVARMNNLLFIDVRLAGMDQTDIGGIPNFIDVTDASGNVVGKRTSYIPNDMFPLQGMGDEKRLLKWNKDGSAKIDAGTGKQDFYDGFLICLDELTSADEAVQAASYQLILDRQVGQHKLLDNVVLVACGNKATDGAIAGKLGTALQSRVITVEVAVHHKSWMSWASKVGINQMILDYLAWKPNFLHDFDPNVDQLTFPCPRTWEKLSNIMNLEGSYTDDVHTLALGTIGKVAAEFKAFVAYYAKLPDIKKILADPSKADLPTEVGQVYALTGVISQAMVEEVGTTKIGPLVTYLERMEPEMQTVAMASALRKTKKLISDKAVSNWISVNKSRITAAL